MLEVLDLDEFLRPFCLCGASGLRAPAGGSTHYPLGSRLWGNWGREEPAVVPLPGSTLHTLLHGCCPFKTSENDPRFQAPGSWLLTWLLC